MGMDWPKVDALLLTSSVAAPVFGAILNHDGTR
jgi:hypothetical protein